MAEAPAVATPPPDPAADKAAALAVLRADSERRRQRFAEAVEAATRETGCDFVQSVVSWVEDGVVKVAPRLDIRDRGIPGA